MPKRKIASKRRTTRKRDVRGNRDNLVQDGVIAIKSGDAGISSFPIRRSDKFAPAAPSGLTEPGGAETWYVWGKPGDTVTLSLERLESSGGHSHLGGPTGTVSPTSVTLGPNFPQNVPVTFTASQTSGSVILKARFGDGTVLTGLNEVAIGGLVALPASTGVALVGQTQTHPSNHWGTPTLVTKLTELGVKFYEKYNTPIKVNDMSLPLGGLFDHKSTWAPPHETHRDGRHADLNRSSMTNAQRQFFKMTAEALGFHVEIHASREESTAQRPVPPPHWHVRI